MAFHDAGRSAAFTTAAWRRPVATIAGLLFWALFAVGCQRKAEPPATLGQVGAFSLVDQDGRSVTDQTLRGKVWVASFFFTHCPTICPRITRRMRALQIEASSRSPPLAFVSFSVDPDNDSPPVLLAYAQRYSADLRSWSFLTGDLGVVTKTVVDGFKLALDGKADANAENGGIIHGSHLVLVDRSSMIRGYYGTEDDAEMRKLLRDAGQL